MADKSRSSTAFQRVCDHFLPPTCRPCRWRAIYRIIPDERPLIERTLKELCDECGCCLVVTTGGTGPAPRDVTPEATEAVCDRMMPGYGEQMRAISLRYVPTAVLSRQTAGLRGKSLIMNLPGKPKSIRETIDEVSG
jgi:molybdopterin adenylyltransferase